MAHAYLTNDPQRVTDAPTLIAVGDDRTCRHAAARALGQATLRGLAQAPTDAGTRYYAPGADDDTGTSVEVTP